MKFNAKLYNRPSYFQGSKCGQIKCLNSYCKMAALRLEGSQDVKAFGYRAVAYTFYNPATKKINRNYFDFFVEKYGDIKHLIACVPDDFQQLEIMQARLEAMEVRAKELGFEFLVWGEETLFGTNPLYRKSIILFCC